jgi:hypothetical protein
VNAEQPAPTHRSIANWPSSDALSIQESWTPLPERTPTRFDGAAGGLMTVVEAVTVLE